MRLDLASADEIAELRSTKRRRLHDPRDVQWLPGTWQSDHNTLQSFPYADARYDGDTTPQEEFEEELESDRGIGHSWLNNEDSGVVIDECHHPSPQKCCFGMVRPILFRTIQ